MLETFEPFRTLLFLPLSESKFGRLFSLFKGLTIPILFACSMRTCIRLWQESPFRWLCDGINTKNAQPGFIPSYENLIGINQIEQQEFTQSTSIWTLIILAWKTFSNMRSKNHRTLRPLKNSTNIINGLHNFL